MIVVNNQYTHGDMVYVVSDPEQVCRQVVAVTILPGEVLLYILNAGGESSEHYAFEISSEVTYHSL